jgi:hypothetical protein
MHTPSGSWQHRPGSILCLASADPQIAFANEVVAAMKSRMTDHAMQGMRRGNLT